MTVPLGCRCGAAVQRPRSRYLIGLSVPTPTKRTGTGRRRGRGTFLEIAIENDMISIMFKAYSLS